MKISKTLLTALLCLIALSAKAGNIPDKLWLVGSATSVGWNLNNNLVAEKTAYTEFPGWYKYTWTGIDLKQGELKFPFSATEWASCLFYFSA